MSSTLFKFTSYLCLVFLAINTPTHAALVYGDATSPSGSLTFSGALRANYQNKSYGEPASDQKIQFNAAIINLKYDSPTWMGAAEYRCYQSNEFCDLSMLVSGYVGYKFNTTDHLKIGLQDIPFGPARYWDSSFYAGINNTMGLQDVLNLGANYHFNFAEHTDVDLAYFHQDGGHYHGDSQHAARYTANVVKSSQPHETELTEKHMWMGRIEHHFKPSSDSLWKSSIGASYWSSDLENHRTKQTGSREAWTVFSKNQFKDLSVVATFGQQDLNNQDLFSPTTSTVGSFDANYQVANEGYFYTIDGRYTFHDVYGMQVSPYLVYSRFDKSEDSFHDSERHIIGAAWTYKNLSLYSEYIFAKNDPFIGGNAQSLAQGDDNKWNRLLNLMLIYSF